MKMILKHIFLALIVSVSYTTFSQCTGSEPVLFLGNDTTVCQMTPRVLTAPPGYTYYNWSTGASSQSITVTTPGTYSVEVVLISGTNKVVNGGFESGNTSFTSGYILGSGNPGYGPLTNEGTYQVTTNPSLVHSLFTSYPFDHSVPGTRMFVANGSFVPGTVIWSQTVAVTPGQDYALSAWFMNVLTTVNVANLQFYINGVPLGSVFSTNVTGNIWEQFYAVWNSGTSTSAVLSVVNQNVNSVGGGNDFAMDDIFFAPICKKTDAITISLASAPTQTIATVGSSSCTGSPNGSITVTSPTAVSYSFDNGLTWQASNVKMNLAPATYLVLSKNSAGCTVSSSVTVTAVTSSLAHTIAFSSPTNCVAPWDGSITITSALGTSFSFDGGTSWQASNTMTGLAAGVYTVKSKDAVGCEVSSTVTIPAAISALTQTTTFVAPTSCAGPADGSITITSALGVSFSFDGGATWQASNTLINLPAGVYSVISKDIGGCTAPPATVTLTSATSALTQTTAFVNPSCTGPADGSITITSALGVSFSFDGGITWQASNTISGVPAGVYVVMSKDVAGCAVQSTLTLTSTTSALAQSTVFVNPSACSATPDGAITITSALGVSFSFDDGATWQVSNTMTGLIEGDYIVKSKDAGGCIVSSLVSLALIPNTYSQTLSSVPPTNCTGISNGSITINSSGGNEFSFDGGTTWQTSNVLNNAAAGNYTVMSKDLVGCIASTDYNLTSLVALPTIATSIVNPVLCAGAANGEITINSATAVLYSFDNGLNWQATNTQNGFAIGTYVVMVQDVLGCENTETVVFVGTPVAMTLNVSPDVSICQNGTTTLTALATGGTSFIYHWDDFASTAASQTIAAGSSTAYYVVHAENQDGCLSAKDSILVTVFNPITAIVSAPVVICSGASFNLAATNVIGGKAPYSYLWSNGVTSVGTLSTISGIATTDAVYTVQIKDACESTPIVLTTSVSVLPFTVPAFQIDNISMCEPGVFNMVNTMDPSLVLSSFWEISSGERFTNQNSISLSDVKFGSYDVNLIVTNTAGCTGNYELANAFEVFASPVANFNVSASTITSLDPTVHFTNWSSGAVSYTWNIESGSPSTSVNEHVTSQFPVGVESSYTVELIAESVNQCVDTMIKVITVVPEPLMFVPNTFTPGNADQVNQTWKPIFSGFDLERGYEVIVFNRWGEIMWKTKDVNASWDGVYNGARVPCGVYSYAIVTKDTVTDKKFYFNGHVNVLK
jgi:gliding motility-associated-like protein